MTVTEKQSSYIRALVAKRAERLRQPEFASVMRMPMGTKEQAGAVISALLEVPEDPPRLVVEEGWYIVSDQPVLISSHPTYGLVGKVWDGKTFRILRQARKTVEQTGRPATPEEIEAVAEEAGSVGRDTSTCQFCMRPLTDEREGNSIERGYGPVCASKYGLPWGVS